MSELKKRGRPRKSADAATEPPAVAETSKPKKRAREAKGQDAESEAANAEDQRPRKRIKDATVEKVAEQAGQPAGSRKTKANTSKKAAETNTVGETAETSARRSKRDRRSADGNPWWSSKSGETPTIAERSEQQTQLANQPARRSQNPAGDKVEKVAKKSNPAKPPPQTSPQGKAQPEPGPSRPSKPQAPASAEGPGVRRSARDRRSADDNPWWSAQAAEGGPQDAQAEKTTNVPPKRSSRGRPSLGEVPVSQAQNKTSKERGQAKKPSKPKPAERASQSKERLPGKGTRRSSGIETGADPKTQRKRTSGGAPEPKGRGRQNEENEASPPEKTAAPATKYRHLASRTRQIPRSIISAKWTALDDGAIAAIDSIITDASRPVLFRLRDRDQRHQQAQTILRTFAKRLQTKLLKGMPFPPPSTATATGRGAAGAAASGHEMELDFERTVDATQSLEKTLDPLLHSVALLTAEKEREEAALEKEYRLLKSLETNARAEARGWRERGKREHALAPEPRAANDSAEGGEERLEVVNTKRPTESGVFEVSQLTFALDSVGA